MTRIWRGSRELRDQSLIFLPLQLSDWRRRERRCLCFLYSSGDIRHRYGVTSFTWRRMRTERRGEEERKSLTSCHPCLATSAAGLLSNLTAGNSCSFNCVQVGRDTWLIFKCDELIPGIWSVFKSFVLNWCLVREEPVLSGSLAVRKIGGTWQEECWVRTINASWVLSWRKSYDCSSTGSTDGLEAELVEQCGIVWTSSQSWEGGQGRPRDKGVICKLWTSDKNFSKRWSELVFKVKDGNSESGDIFTLNNYGEEVVEFR